MNSEIRNFLSIFLLLPLIVYSGAALADKGGNGKGHGKNKFEFNNRDDDHDEGSDRKPKKHGKTKKHESAEHAQGIIFGSYDQIVIREYLSREHKTHCPPGLAKKHNGCLPPGLAKKHYVIGQPLYGDWHDVPHDLLISLGAAPAGHRYVMVDKDVLLISEASKKVIDAVTLLSAVGK